MNKVFRRLLFLSKFHQSIPFLRDFFLSDEVHIGKKMFYLIAIIGYILFPFDLIPDILLGIGIVDDITVAALLLQQMVKTAPNSLKEKHQLM